MTVGLALDALIAILLAATIGYCIMLHRRLEEFRAASGEIKNAMASFTQSMVRAEVSTAALKKAALEVGEELQSQIDQGRALSNELQFFVDTAKAGRSARSNTPDGTSATVLPDRALLAEDAARSEAERELKRAIRQIR